ncbi:MAG TPA: glycoside hydrolase family 32 protein [Devosiaceae bacterium]|jgi:beta-fructofuranosidase|nr:glycoside hydrolase family 32 protein [Devosiaceae bacterium]
MSKRLLSAAGEAVVHGGDWEIEVELGEPCVVHAWGTTLSDEGSTLMLSLDGERVATAPLEKDSYRFLEAELDHAGRLKLSVVNGAVSVVYAYHPNRALKDGITLLYAAPATATPGAADGVHFRPLFGWMNDPNGLSHVRGQFHLFYQHYPHVPEWNTMHWGHAVSDDLLHWRHLPIFLRPNQSSFPKDVRSGGNYSGSAIAVDEGLRVFFTERKQDRLPEDQIQRTALSTDLLAPGPPVTILPLRPDLPGLTKDFRDPYVFLGPDGRLKMLVGGRDNEGGLVLLYETESGDGAEGWRFCGILHKQTENPQSVCECPCFVSLGDGLWALIYGMLSSQHRPTGRRNMSTVLVGRFDGLVFTPEHEQELDFGSDAYAFQATPTPNGPVGLSWLANWSSLIKTQATPTAMTLPREVKWDGSRVCMPPVPAVAELRTEPLDGTALLQRGEVGLPASAIEIELELTTPGAAFRLMFDHPTLELGLQCGPAGLEILHRERNRQAHTPRYIAHEAAPERLNVFLDAGSIEVFADHGRWCGTKRLEGFEAVRRLTLAEGSANIKRIELFRLAL